MHPDSTATFGFQFGQVLVTDVFLIIWQIPLVSEYLEALLVLSLGEGKMQITSLHLVFNFDRYETMIGGKTLCTNRYYVISPQFTFG